MSLPHPQDAIYLAVGGEAGQPEIDAKGRLVYHGVYRPKPRERDPSARNNVPDPVQIDSSPIVRADFDTRQVDTLTALKLNLGAPFDRRETDAQGNVTMHYWASLFDADDQWAMLSDGTIAIVSVQDYHIEWLDTDGRRRSTPKMPFDWRRVTDARKQFLIDSLRVTMDSINDLPARSITTADGLRELRAQYSIMPADKWNDYEQPIESGAVKADLNERLWIIPHTSSGANGGLLYDVINKQGQLAERVQFPKNHVLVGFGAGGDVYVMRVDGRSGVLERRRISGTP